MAQSPIDSDRHAMFEVSVNGQTYQIWPTAWGHRPDYWHHIKHSDGRCMTRREYFALPEDVQSQLTGYVERYASPSTC